MDKVYIAIEIVNEWNNEETVLGVFTSFNLAEKCFIEESHNKFEFSKIQSDIYNANTWTYVSKGLRYYYFEIKEVTLNKTLRE